MMFRLKVQQQCSTKGKSKIPVSTKGKVEFQPVLHYIGKPFVLEYCVWSESFPLQTRFIKGKI
jgi:hypothetical protein